MSKNWTPGPWWVKKENGELRVVNERGYVSPHGDDAYIIATSHDGVALAEMVMDYCRNPYGISKSKQDELYDVALVLMNKAMGERQ